MHPAMHHITTLDQTHQTQQTLDAASEFNVALVPNDNIISKQQQPPPYTSRTYGTANNGVFV